LKILLVEDSQRLQRSISAGLRAVGHTVDQAFDGKQALGFTESYEYDVIILDLMLPQIDGLTVLATLRKRNNRCYVLILSARDQIEDRIQGLDHGADDYLVKPFSFDELVSRLRALSRRRTEVHTPVIDLPPLHIDTVTCQVSCAGQSIWLTPTEFSLLEYLARRCGQVITHQQLIDQLCDATAGITRNAIEVHISSLRKKLKKSGVPPLIKTRRGFGYLIEKP
jgi:DNA-binding response OmpR family regulator